MIGVIIGWMKNTNIDQEIKSGLLDMTINAMHNNVLDEERKSWLLV
jgi:hypothetical protein